MRLMSMRKVVLEVERKFCGLAVPRLTIDAGHPPFSHLTFLGQSIFTDSYYDHEDKLSTNGLWVRKRETQASETEVGAAAWQAKYRRGGDFTNSRFEEITDVCTIAQHVRDLVGGDADGMNFGLKPLAVIETTRRSWLADGAFHIDLDSTDFGHEVGEVELEEEVTVPSDIDNEPAHEKWKEKVAGDMDARVERFMKQYAWAWLKGTPKGKLTAFFEHQVKTKHRDAPS